MLKILVISGSPWFQARGGHSATYNTLKGVCKQGHEVTYLYPTTNYLNELSNVKKTMQTGPPNFNLIPVNTKQKKPISYYLNALRRMVLRRIYSRPKNSERIKKEFFHYLTDKPDHNLGIFSEEFLTVIKSYLDKKKYDLIQVDYPAALKIIHFLDYDIPKVFVNHEIQMIRAIRTIEAKKGDKKKYKSFLDQVCSIERRFMKKYDSVIVLTETDSKNIKELYSIESYVSPLSVDTNYFKRNTHNSNPIRLIFSGGENHYPNKNAIDWFCTDILPVLNKMTKNYILYITGKWSNKFVRKYSTENVVFTGFVDDLREYLRGAISVAPLRIGGGIRVKILEAMSMECGVVSTAIGCEGLGVENKKNILQAETPEEFAESIIMLATDRDLYETLGSAARDLVVNNFSIYPVANLRIKAYEQIIAQYKNRRSPCT